MDPISNEIAKFRRRQTEAASAKEREKENQQSRREMCLPLWQQLLRQVYEQVAPHFAKHDRRAYFGNLDKIVSRRTKNAPLRS